MKHRVSYTPGPCKFHSLGLARSAIVLLLVVMGITPPQPAHAAVIVVNTLADEEIPNGNCSLREAIFAANNDKVLDACIAGSGADVIDLTGVAGTITLAGTELSITSDVILNGPGADQLTISGNQASRLFNIAMDAEVTIDDVTIANGYSESHGGGIINLGALTINRCIISHNVSTQNGGGIINLYVLEVKNSSFFDNQASFNGGGIYNRRKLVVSNSTFSGNRASEGGTLDNYGGGGICNKLDEESADLTINNATIAFNSAKWGGGISNFDGTVNIRNTIVVENTVHAGGVGSNCHHSGFGGATSRYSLESGTDCGFTGAGDLQNAEAELMPLLDYGGTTLTHALQSDSQAINAGSCTDTNLHPVIYDQRGAPRKSPCDIGAYEYLPQIYLPLVKRD